MRHILSSLLIIVLVSCQKTLLHKDSPGWNMDVTVQEGEDSALASSAVFCYPNDWKNIHDTTIYYNNYPDTGTNSDDRSYYEGGTFFWYQKYVYDNKYFTYAGVDVVWIGPINHRRYFTILKIKRIYQKTN